MTKSNRQLFGRGFLDGKKAIFVLTKNNDMISVFIFGGSGKHEYIGRRNVIFQKTILKGACLDEFKELGFLAEEFVANSRNIIAYLELKGFREYQDKDLDVSQESMGGEVWNRILREALAKFLEGGESLG